VNGARRYRVVVCRGPECGERRDSASLYGEFQRELKQLGLESQVELGWQACFGRCRQGPNVLVRLAATGTARTPLLATLPAGPGSNAALYNGVRRDDVSRILTSHVTRGIIVRDLILKPEGAATPTTSPSPVPTDPDSGKPSGES
jgi:(2Fe-2S) ferredoxin